MSSCWVTHGCTGSGDSIKILIFKNEPNTAQVDSIYRVLYPQEYRECYGVNWELSESLFIEND